MTDIAAPGTPFLIHSFEHRAYPLLRDRALTIGRETACDITVNEVAVSRYHAEVRAEGDHFALYPMGSTSTIMNGVPVQFAQALHEGDNFHVGSMRFVFTRGRLPVAMKVAEASDRASTVDGRRPTLIFPARLVAGRARKGNRRAMLTFVLLIVLAIGGYGVYHFALIR